MITINRIGSALQRFFENTAKARMNSVLLGMDRDRLAEMGYSYQLLRRGPAAWPWRESNQDGALEADKTNQPGATASVSFEPSPAAGNLPRSESGAANPQESGFDVDRDAA